MAVGVLTDGCRAEVADQLATIASDAFWRGARWHSGGVNGASFALARSVREVLLGDDPPVALTDRARTVLVSRREAESNTVSARGTAIVRDGTDLRWFTWAGFRANATLASTLSDLVDGTQRVNSVSIRMRDGLTREMWSACTADATTRLVPPAVDRRALEGLKFADALPRRPSPPGSPTLREPCRRSRNR